MSSYGELINKLEKEKKDLIRKRENTNKKLINAKLTITFNEIYIYI